jgi:hydrogenase maturation protease
VTGDAGTARSADGLPHASTIVLGLGNPVLRDDGVGWRIAEAVQDWLAAECAAGRPRNDVEVDRLSVGGLRLMERLTGYRRAILVDSALVPDAAVGEVRAAPLDALQPPAGGHLDSAHDASLRTALDVGRRLGAELPARIDVVTVQAESVYDFGEDLTPEVEAAVPIAALAVVDLIRQANQA